MCMKSFETCVAVPIPLIYKGLVIDLILLLGTWLNIQSLSANVEPQSVSKHMLIDVEADGKNYITASR